MTDRNEIDGTRMRWLEAKAREIGQHLKVATNRNGEQFGFCLLLLSFDGPEMTYIANADRASMVEALKEFIAKFESGEARGTWAERN